MKKMIVLMIGLGVILGGCRKKEKQEAASGQAAPEILVNRPAQHDVVYTYQYPAYLEAVQTVNLVARVSGFLEKMNYIPGVPVKAGQLLFVIEPQPYQDQLKAAQAEMKSTEARLAYARAQYEKMKEAMPSRAISEIDFIQAESDYHSAIANLQNARAQLNTAQTNLNIVTSKLLSTDGYPGTWWTFRTLSEERYNRSPWLRCIKISICMLISIWLMPSSNKFLR